MQYRKTTAVDKILAMKQRLKIIQGGSSAGKTIAILLILIDKAQASNCGLISVVSETFPHLKKGAIRDFLSIMESHKYYNENNWNRTDSIYTFETGSKIEFFSADNSNKVRGPRRQTLFLNEANNISYEVYTQLAIRTDEEIYIDYNPVTEFWVHQEILPTVQHDFIILTYKDNEALSPSIIQELESRKDKRGFWSVYGLGILGEIEGKIYQGWKIVDELPHEARLWRRGIDFGYSVDPTVIIAIYEYNGGFILNEELYQKGLSNKTIADFILNQPDQGLCIADSAEPKSIDEIASYGVNIMGAHKGAGSVAQGIQFVQGQKISVTAKSLKTIAAYRNYLWDMDKNGKNLQIPNDSIHEWSNPMDAIRYGFNGAREDTSVLRKQQDRFQTNKFHILSNSNK